MQAKYHTSTTSPSYTVLECEPHRLVDDLMYYIGADTLKMHRKWRFPNAFRPLVECKIARLTPEMDGATWLPERPTEAEQLEALRQAERLEALRQAERLEALRQAERLEALRQTERSEQ